MSRAAPLLLSLLLMSGTQSFYAAQETHDHPVPEVLGSVTFPISCTAEVQGDFNRSVALLHSFAYAAALNAFQAVAERDPKCAMAYWGVAMSGYHQLWEPAISADGAARAQRELSLAMSAGAVTDRERGFLNAANAIFKDADTVPIATRAGAYEKAMAELAARYPADVEVQTFYALALLANASPSDKTHARQKHAADILEALFKKYPQHPAIPHYLIHAYDNAELAERGLPAARAYAQVAPSAPHALHMPSHIFTRLGLWEDSIASNTAARTAAHRAGDIGEELHAMDYLVYAQLQLGRDEDAAQIVGELKKMESLHTADFKVGYAATVMPIRYALERGKWAEAVQLPVPESAPPHVRAIAIWAQSIGNAHMEKAKEASGAVAQLQQIEDDLQGKGNGYWATQVRVLKREAMAWVAFANHDLDKATSTMRQAADEEDAVEKLPVTPGPVIPAREQLGELLLEQGKPALAVEEFNIDLRNSPNRRRGRFGLNEATKKVESNHRDDRAL
ncbi:TPR repeat protein [Candidatus Koribacter versatilis Ellin345]|uniref:TPR repeat protein n=1 Tax=Koribacter versatilis (strain Ellin345) TaxID=204669 RepID=Q1IKE4_KORVE|nr:hypothetical protein [Candidatus Koribacter versatilis]ABF42656.1 TPR repeat protein [Candidatus Koribacter versatilis Ellin345]